MKTLFIDIDGVIIEQKPDLTKAMEYIAVLLPGVKEKFNEWNWKNYKIILTTGRKESTRQETEAQLKSLGLFWDVLIMGLDAGGERYLINNKKKLLPKKDTAFAINLLEDEGLSKVDL